MQTVQKLSSIFVVLEAEVSVSVAHHRLLSIVCFPAYVETLSW